MGVLKRFGPNSIIADYICTVTNTVPAAIQAYYMAIEGPSVVFERYTELDGGCLGKRDGNSKPEKSHVDPCVLTWNGR